tara:strand:+ start:19 stop:240 length:222 start_codon:yes stop_codon:yes gene_type:complete
MKFRNGLRIHEVAIHDFETPVLPKGYKHPAGLTCGHCGAEFNTGFALGSHKTSTHYPLPYLLSDWGEVLEEMK